MFRGFQAQAGGGHRRLDRQAARRLLALAAASAAAWPMAVPAVLLGSVGLATGVLRLALRWCT